MKKIISLAVAALMLGAVLVPAGATETPQECAPATIIVDQEVKIGKEYEHKHFLFKINGTIQWFDSIKGFPWDYTGNWRGVYETQQVEVPNPDYDPECGQEPEPEPTQEPTPEPTQEPTPEPTEPPTEPEEPTYTDPYEPAMQTICEKGVTVTKLEGTFEKPWSIGACPEPVEEVPFDEPETPEPVEPEPVVPIVVPVEPVTPVVEPVQPVTPIDSSAFVPAPAEAGNAGLVGRGGLSGPLVLVLGVLAAAVLAGARVATRKD